ncbi:retention module-containing protein [Cellvibrio mixtus]|uniref:retention module-containing protein n=1 Tax=Cellvibrio mixtus TaxID=39650 RepID=UPI000694FB7B|nr:retention module-containing protein [Cellvibrio mixtus]
MSNAVATVAFLQGQAWAKSPDGSLRPLTVGSTLNADEVLVTAQGAQVQLDFGNGEPIQVSGGLEVAMSRDFSNNTATDTDEAALNDASVQEALTVLEQGGDLLEALEETAAGESGGGTSDGSHDFVRLTRIIEQTDPQSFDYQNASTNTDTTVQTDGNPVAYINRAPSVTDQTLAATEDEPLRGQVIASDIEGDSITYTLTTPATNGVVVLDPVTGQFTFTPAPNYSGSDSFVVTVTDSRGNSSTTTINLNIGAVNDAPTTSDVNLTTDEDTPVAGQVIASDIEGDTLTYTISGQPANGTVTLNPATGGFVYTPNANYNGSDSFVVTVSDGKGGTTTSTVRIGVTPVNDAPTSSDQNLVTAEDTPINGRVVAADVDGDTLGYTISGQPTSGTVTINAATGEFVYTPNANYNGSDSFVVTISDGNGGITSSTINIGVTPVNDAPVSNDQNLTTAEDTPLNGQVVATDVDGDTLAYIVSGQPANGTVTLNPVTGGFVYTPNANYNGSDSFVVTISDGNGGTVTSRINIGVTPVNDAPVSSDVSLITPEDIPVSGQVNATDIDGDTLSFTVTGSPANGSVVLNAGTGSFTYTPNANYNGSDSFVVTISDGKGGTTTSLVTIGVTPVNDAPVASNLNLNTNENTAVNGAISASDADGDTLSFLVSGAPANGTVVLNAATGTFVYTPNAGYSGSDSFLVTISDGKGGTTTSLVSIGVAAVNHAPTAAADTASTDEGTAVTIAVRANDTDPDGDSLKVTGVTQGANGSVIIDAVTGNPIYTPDAGFVGTDNFTYTIDDGNGGTDTAVVTVTVNAVLPTNNAPVASADIIDVAEGGTISSLRGGATSVLANDSDVDGDPLTAVLVSGPANGTLTFHANGEFTYVHNGSETTTDSFTYKVNDGTVDGNTVTVNINVAPVNDAPVSVADKIKVVEGGTATVLDITGATSVLANDSDAEGNTLTAVLVTGPTNGTLTLNANGTFSYTHNGSETTSDSFTYRANDGTTNGNIVTVIIEITPVNDAPVANNDTVTVLEDGSVTVAVRSNDTDAEGDPLTVNSVTQGANGSVVIDAVTGNPIYTPNAGFSGTDSFTYTVRDPAGAVSNTATVTVTVTSVNHAPVAVPDTFTVSEGGTLSGASANVLTNDSDADGNTLTAILVTGPTNGTLVLNANGQFTYVHNGSETTNDSFTYKVNDGTVDGNTVTVTINVTPVNDAPQTNAAVGTGNEDSLVTITLSGSDVDGSVAGYVIKTLPANGVLYSDSLMTTPISAGDLVTGPVYFMPNANWNGTATFDYAARDNLGLEDPTPATATITVNPVADPAVLGAGTGSVKEDTPAQTTASGTLSIIDPDAGEQAFQAQTNVPGTYGSFSVNASGSWVYTLDNTRPAVQALKEGETKTETFTVASIDGTTTSVVITVNGTNDGPVAAADAASVNQNATLTLTPAQLLANDTDTDGDSLSLVSVQGAVNGTVKIDGGNVVFTPTPGYHGPASFTYTISDGHSTATATTNVTVQKLNSPPVANDDSGAGSAVNHGLFSEYYSYRQGTDGPNLDNLAQVLSFISSHAATATFTTTRLDYNVGNVFNNGLGFGNNLQTFLGSDAASLTNDPASSSDAIIRMRGFVELAPGTYNFKVYSDDGYQIKVDGVVVAEVTTNQTPTSTTHTQFTIATGGVHTLEIVYWDQGWNAVFSAELSDNAGVTYKPFSNYSSHHAAIMNVVEDIPLSIPASSLLANDTDADGDTLSILSVQGAVNGTVALVGGNVVFTPASNYNGAASFTYTITDGKGGMATATVNLQVTPVNDAPVAVNDTALMAQNGTLSIPVSTLLANDSDPEGYVLTIASVQEAVNGTVSLSGSHVIFTPTTGFEGVARFTYTVADQEGLTSKATVNVTVGSASTPSVVVSKSLVAIAHGTGGTSVKFPITTKLVDTDGSESLSIKISNVPTGVSFNAGVNLGGGVWQFTEADLPNLTLNLPGSYTTNATHLTVQVTSTEVNGGATASVSSVVTLKAGYTTVDITTTEHGSYTGSSANEYIQGGNGNNTINGSNGNNIINGGAGDDNLSAGSGSDIINGGSGNDTINAGSGSDHISGGSGNDLLKGGDAGENFVDVFVWSLGDQGAAGTPAVDTIQNFSTAAASTNGVGGDVLDLRDLLQGESVGASNGAGNLANYLHFEVSGSNTIIHISHTGGFGADSHSVGGSYTSTAETQQIVLEGVNLQSTYSGATTDQQIITQLLNNNKLITD